MSTKGKHLHIERPSLEQIKSVLQSKAPVIRQLYFDMHMLILDILPDVVYSIDCQDGQMGYGARQYGYNGWGMAALSAHSKWISLVFLCGTSLEDPDKLLEGTGKNIRHVKLRSTEQLEKKCNALSRLIKAASKLYE